MISPLRIPKGIIIICIALFGSLSLAAQTIAKSTPRNVSSALKNTPSEIQPLSIGDVVPEILFENVLNYKSKKAKLSDFKGKLVILDMWSTWCTSCIAAFPKMELLQNEFKDKIQILLVNPHDPKYDSEEKIKLVLEKLKTRTGFYPTLPIPIHDSILNTYFPHHSVPHQVWIDGNGKVLAITYSAEVISSNIKAILEGKKLTLHTKNDIFFDLQSQTLPELIYGVNSTLGKPLSSSVIIKGLIDGLGFGTGVRRLGKSYQNLYTGWYIRNMSLIEIYRAAYKIKYPANRIIIEVSDELKFKKINPNDTSWYSNVYSYDITIPPTSFDELVTFVQRDLEQTFHTKVISERRKIKCLVLTTTSQSDKSYTKGGDRKYVTDKIDPKKYIRNYPIADFVNELNLNYFKIPMVDETALSLNIDIDLPYELTQESIIIALKKAGFEIRDEERYFDVIVISNK